MVNATSQIIRGNLRGYPTFRSMTSDFIFHHLLVQDDLELDYKIGPCSLMRERMSPNFHLSLPETLS